MNGVYENLLNAVPLAQRLGQCSKVVQTVQQLAAAVECFVLVETEHDRAAGGKATEELEHLIELLRRPAGAVAQIEEGEAAEVCAVGAHGVVVDRLP